MPDLVIFTSVLGLAASVLRIASSGYSLAASQDFMRGVKVNPSVVPEKISNGTTVRLGVGLNNTVLQGFPLEDAQGDLPTLVIFNENKEVIGHSRLNTSERVGSGSFVDIHIEHEEWAINQQATHLQVIAGRDGICIAYLTLTMADSTKRGWLGDMGRACGYDWGYSNIIVGESGYKPRENTACTWIERTHARGVYAAGLQIDMDVFTMHNEIPPEAVEYFCNPSRMLFMDQPDYSFENPPKADGDQKSPLFAYWQGQKQPRHLPKSRNQTVAGAPQEDSHPVSKSSNPTVTKAPHWRPEFFIWRSNPTVNQASQKDAHPTSLPHRRIVTVTSTAHVQKPRITTITSTVRKPRIITVTSTIHKYAHPTSLPKTPRRQRRTDEQKGNGDVVTSNDNQKSNSNTPVTRVSHPHHSAKFACQSKHYKGPSIITPWEGLFCDSRTRTLYPLCGCQGHLETDAEGNFFDVKVALLTGTCFDEGFVGLRHQISAADMPKPIKPIPQEGKKGDDDGEPEAVKQQRQEKRRTARDEQEEIGGARLRGRERGGYLGKKRRRDEVVRGALLHKGQVATTDTKPVGEAGVGERWELERFNGPIEAWDTNLFHDDDVDLQTGRRDCRSHHY